MKQLLLLLLPTAVLASIDLNLRGSVVFDDNPPYIYGKIDHEGFIERLVNDNDKNAFNIIEDELKDAIERHHGKRPDQVLYQNINDTSLNAPWSGNVTLADIYERKGLKKVQIKIEPLTAYLVDIKTENVCLNGTEHKNNMQQTITKIFQKPVNFTDSITSLWSNTELKGDHVNVKINFKVENDSAVMSNAFEFGASDRAFKNNILRRRTTFRLHPNKTVTVRFIAKKGILKFEIPYKVSLSGDVVAGYNTMYKDQHSFTFNIVEILQSYQRHTTIQLYQVVKYEFNYDVKFKIYAQDGTVLKTVSKIQNFAGTKKAEDIGEKILIKAAMSPKGLIEIDNI